MTRPIYVFLGDYIDRGRWSRETIDRLISHGADHESVFLKGNHELIAVSCLSDRTRIDQWLRLGGRETLASYGVPPELFTKRAQSQRRNRHSTMRCLRHISASSEVCVILLPAVTFSLLMPAPGRMSSFRIKARAICSGSGANFSLRSHDFGKIIVHGHTPASEVEIRRNRINIDTGAFATGRLTCLVVEGEELEIIDTAVD